jgi:hypothetical protein
MTVDQRFSPVSHFCNMSIVTSDVIPLCALLGGDLIAEFLNQVNALHSPK